MVKAEFQKSAARRRFLTRIGVGAAALGAGLAAPVSLDAQARVGAATPTRHPLDDWFDQAGTKHRIVFDTTSPPGAGSAALYAGNFLTANKDAYSVDAPDIGIVIVLRHFSTVFAYNDAIWAKYGKVFSDMLGYTDPHTKQAPSVNLYNAAGYGRDLPNFGTTLTSLSEKGVRFAVCDMATHFFAGELAPKTNGNADAIYKELSSNLIMSGHLVPAGIVAVNRAQERGYTFAFAE